MRSAHWSIITTRMQRQLASAVLEAVWPKLKWQEGNGFVLDLGCGPGDVTAYELLPRLPVDVRVVAADLGDTVLYYAAPKFNGPRLCFLELDIGARGIHDTGVWRLGPYLKVFSFFSLQWVQHQRRAIQTISELLCSGGEAAIALISRTGLFTIFEILSKSPKWSSYLLDYKQVLSPYQFSEDPKDELNIYLEEAGLSVEACCENEIVYVTEEVTEVRDTMVALNPFFTRIPEDEREAFIRDCEEEAFKSGSLSVLPRSDGKISYFIIYKALIAHAVKN